MRPEDEQAFAYVVHRALYYKRVGTTHCGICGAVEPHAQDVFSEVMPCGHAWRELVWVPNARKGE